jgi:hypothetical protein
MPPYRLPVIRIPIRPQIPTPKLSMESEEKKQEITIPTYTPHLRAVS